MSERAIEMIEEALSMEEKGKKFYNDVIAKCDNKLGLEIFKTLMADEDVHVSRIRTIYESLNSGKGWTNEWKAFKADHQALKPMFRELARKYGKAMKGETSDIEALGIGMDFERRSVEYYEGASKKAEDPIEKAFIAKMIEEEKGHHAVLADMKFYLTDPASWFREQERTGLDGA